MPRRREFVKCPQCGVSLNVKNLRAHLWKVHPGEVSPPTIEIELDGKLLKIYLPCEEIYKRYEGALKEEIAKSEGLIEKIWREVCELFGVKEAPVPKVWITIEKGVIAHNLTGESFCRLPSIVDAQQKTIHVYNPDVRFTPYTYYIESLTRLKDEPILARTLIHEFSHSAFILGGPKNKGYLLEFAWRATNPNTRHTYGKLRPFAGILPDQNFPLTPATLLLEDPAMWGEERIGEKLLGDAAARTKRVMEFHEKRDQVLNKYLEKYFLMSPITPNVRTKILNDHWKAVRGRSLIELYEYVEKELGKILGIDITAYYDSFEQFCKIEVHKEYSPPPRYDPNDGMSRSWDSLLEIEFGYTD